MRTLLSVTAALLSTLAFHAHAQDSTGVVKSYSDAKGYGLITPDDEGADLFFSFAALRMPGFQTVKPGQKVIYVLQSSPKGDQATNIRIAGSASAHPGNSGAGASPPVKPPATLTNRAGVVKSYDDAKGYGFITPSEKGADVFFHFAQLQMAGFKTAKAGQRVIYDLQTGPKGDQAMNIRFTK